MKGSQKISPWCISAAGAGLYAIWMGVLAKASGPHWIMVPNDLVYTYLFNGLNLLTGHPLGALVHPGTTASLFFALCTWLIHATIGSGELARDVIEHAELYMSSISAIVVALNTTAIFALGQFVYVGTRRRPLILVAQGSFILCPALFLALNSFGSPESFQILFLTLLLALTIGTLENGLRDLRTRAGYAGATALIVGAAIGAKFTSAPMIVLPLLAIPTIRWKAIFLGLAILSALVFLSPIFLVPENWRQFLLEAPAMASQIQAERASAGAGSFLGNFATQARDNLRGMPVFTTILIFQFICCALLWAFGARQRPDLAKAYRLYCAFMLTVAAMVGFILLRPSPKYLGFCTVVLGTGLVLIIFMVGQYFSAAVGRGKLLRQLPDLIAGAIVALYLVVGLQQFGNTGVAYLVRIRDDALEINKMMYPIPKDRALVTAIPTSNLYTAFDQSNGWSENVHVPMTAEITPSNQYDYRFDGSTVLDRSNSVSSLHSLKQRYSQVYYWSARGNFESYGWRRRPHAVMRNLFTGQDEAVAEIEAVALQNPYEPDRPADENAARGWSDPGGATGGRNIRISFGGLRDEIVTYYEFHVSKPQNAREMPSRWKVEASLDGSDWQTLATVRDDKPWSAGETRRYPLDNVRAYRAYRLVELEGQEYLRGSWPSNVELLSAGSSGGVLVPSAVSFVPRKALSVNSTGDSPFEEVTMRDRPSWDKSGPFWEKVGPFPLGLQFDFPTPTKAQGYLMLAGPYGTDSTLRMPTAWELLGSDDGRSWTSLDVHSGEGGWKNMEERTFRISDPKEYAHYRFVFYATSSFVIRIENIQLLGQLNTFTDAVSAAQHRVETRAPSEARRDRNH